MEISLAKPLSDKRKQAQAKREQRKGGDAPFNPRDDIGSNNPPVGPSSRPMQGGFGKNQSRGPMNPPDDSFSK